MDYYVKDGAANNTRPILLSEYKPKSTLRLETHEVVMPKFKVFDVHTHMGSLILGNKYEEIYDTRDYMKSIEKYGVNTVVNLDGATGSELERMLAKTKGFEDRIITFGWVDTSDIDDPGFAGKTEYSIKESYRKGIKGLKLWKNISLGQKDKSGRYIKINDKRLKVIWDTAAELDIPVLIHIADPVASFEPIDEYNEMFEIYSKIPEWSYSSPEFYRYDELMEMQEDLIYSNPQTVFIVAHAGSASEDLKFLSRCFDKYPNMYIDIAERHFNLGRQPYSARKLFIEYPDRILFGTDHFPGKTILHDIYYRFLETDDEYFDYDKNDIPFFGRWRIYGIYLPDDVLEKVYYKNAERLILKKR